jgi:PAS domain S-box-containing protein
MPPESADRRLVVQGTEILASDPPHLRRQKLARITLDSMVQFVGLLDPQGTVLEINKVALDAVGIKLAEVEGKPFWTTFWWEVSEEIRVTLRANIARAARGESVRWDTPIYGRAGGKETIIIDASLCPVVDDGGNVVFLCAEGRDITEKQAQEQEIAQKNIELHGLLERIRELDEIKTQFFANVSHELRTPLALILGPAQRLIDDAGTMDLAERRASSEVIVRSARMLLKHVNDLLDMSKLEVRKLKIELQETDVAALVRFLTSHFAVLAAERRIDYAVDADRACVASVDPDKLQRIVMNLLGNAFKFVPAGGRIRCALRQTPHELAISVDDSGPGVPLELRQAIFERFRQGDGGLNRKAGGTGLGLAIAKELVELHKGRIEVLESELGGARFQITLPLRRLADGVQAAPDASLDRTMLDGVLAELRSATPGIPDREEEAPRAPARAPAAPGRPRVLVVEDNADMNRFITQCLGRTYEVATAFDGREGLAQALRFRPLLVVSDIMMPNMSGVEMIARMRVLPELAQTPVLLLSAKADEDLMVRLLDDGAQDFIVKPFSERELAVRVKNLVLAQQAREATIGSLTREHVAREEAELQKRLLHSLFMQAPTLIAVLRGPAHVIELANPPICQIWGRAEADVLGRPLLDVLPEFRDQVFPALLEHVYTTGAPHVGKETPTRFDRGAGRTETLYFNFAYSPCRTLDGQIEGVFVIATDVTAQVLARDQLDDLRTAAETANQAKDEFLAMLGHELRNPLSPILTALQVMKLRGAAGSERERIVIERQVNHLTRLVDDLLDVSRIARGKVELKIETLEISEVVGRAIEMASPLLSQRTHTLTVDVPSHGLRVHGDRTRLSQVVSNLLTNAAKYTPPGGDIAIRGQQVNDEVVLSVRDTGIGIEPETLRRIFELFVQERQALDRSQGGLGIGLAIVRSLIERHGGTVVAHSEGAGKGSEFLVRLPATSRPRDLVDPPTPSLGALVPPVGTRRILIVDDNEDGAEMLADALTRRGYDTRVAHDAPAALRVAAEFSPDIAFLDIGLPVMDGYELASRLRELPGLAGLRLIAVTGYGQESDRRRTRTAGFHHHLVKPVDIATIEATLMIRDPRPADDRGGR